MTRYCSFCGKSEHEVFRLIQSINSYICEGCVELSALIIKVGRTEHCKQIVQQMSVCKTCDGTRMVRTSRDEKVSNPGVYDKKCPDCA